MAIKTSSSIISFFFLYLLLSSIDFVSSSAINDGLQAKRIGSERRLMIGSMAPHCTYNECRGCRFKCQAEQVPVDTNDPMNSAYRYRCVCHM